MNENIHPIFDKLIQRTDRERRFNQKSMVIWLTGLSGSGKSTIAQGLEQRLFSEGFIVQVLDGDNIRTGISNNLSFSAEDREENIRRISEVSKLFIDSGVVTINSFVSPMKKLRALACNVIGQNDFIEVYVKASIELCEQRDVKGLYKKARAGEIKNFTGVDAPFEEPENPDLVLDTGEINVEQSIDKLYTFLIPKIKNNA